MSTRSVKLRKDPEFLYDAASIEFLNKSRSRRNPQNQGLDICSDSDIPASSTNIDGKGHSPTLFWTDIEFCENNTNICEDNISQSELHQLKKEATQLFQPTLNIQEEEEEEEEPSVNGSSVNKLELAVRTSSTRLDYLSDFEECFLSASSVEHTDSSEMELGNGGCSNNKKQGTCEGCVAGSCVHAKSAVGAVEASTTQALWDAINKIDKLTSKMNSLEKLVCKQNEIIGNQDARLNRVHSAAVP